MARGIRHAKIAGAADRVARTDWDAQHVDTSGQPVDLDLIVGTPGPPGIQGPPGNDGAPGTQGIQGPPGADSIVPGPQGLQGIPGLPGADGAQGIPGNDGAQGIQGLQGLPGNDGAPGSPGAQGDQGIQGIQGVPGNDGAQGLQGPPGIVSTLRVPLAIPVLAALAWTNMPSALSFWLSTASVAKGVERTDLTGYTQVRLRVNKQGTAGAAASKLILRYKASPFTQVVANYCDIGASEVSVAVKVKNTYLDTAYITLVAGAKADVFLALLGSGGGGALDPRSG